MLDAEAEEEDRVAVEGTVRAREIAGELEKGGGGRLREGPDKWSLQALRPPTEIESERQPSVDELGWS